MKNLTHICVAQALEGPVNGTGSMMGDCFGLAWINAMCPPKPLSHSPCSAGPGRGNMKGSRVEIRAGRHHSPIAVTDKTD